MRPLYEEHLRCPGCSRCGAATACVRRHGASAVAVLGRGCPRATLTSRAISTSPPIRPCCGIAPKRWRQSGELPKDLTVRARRRIRGPGRRRLCSGPSTRWPYRGSAHARWAVGGWWDTINDAPHRQPMTQANAIGNARAPRSCGRYASHMTAPTLAVCGYVGGVSPLEPFLE